MKRIVTALIGIPLLLLVIHWGGAVFALIIGLLSLLALWEFHVMMNISPGSVMFLILSGIASCGIIIMSYLGDIQLLNAVIVIYLLSIFIISILVHPKYTLSDISVTFMGTVYIAVLFSYLILIRLHLLKGYEAIIFVFICIWFTDSFAYFTGTYLGKRKLSPGLSPNKTVEGAIGGLLGALLAAIIIGMFFNFRLNQTMIIGIILGVFGQLGDLSESMMKRFFNVKDSGNIIPGHGGVLDRFDSVLLAAPILYYYLLLVDKI